MVGSVQMVRRTLGAAACLLLAFASPAFAQGEPLQTLTPQLSGAPTVKLFGYAVDRQGAGLAVGAPGNLNFNVTTGPAGAVFVYSRQLNGSWSFANLLQAPTVVTDDAFGYAVEQTASQVIVGAPFADVGGPNRGRVYAFTRQGAGFSAPQAIDTGVALNNDARFGGALSQDSGWLAIGAVGAGLGGHVQLFRYDGDFEIWVPHSVIPMPTPSNNAQFGTRVLVRGDRLLVAAPGESSAAGYAYEFQRSGSGAAATWTLRQRFRPSGVPGLDFFGQGIDLSDDAATLAVSAYASSGGGRVYLFERNVSGDWAQFDDFNDRPSIVSSANYGYTLRFDGDFLYAADIRARLSGSASRPGNLYRLHRTAGPGFDLERDYARPGAENDFYGQDFAIENGELAIGAPGVDATGNDDEGRVFIRTDTQLNEAPGLIFNQSQTLTQGEQSAPAITLGQVIDFESPSVTIAVSQIAGGTATGVSASGLSISGDDLLGTLVAGCAATSGTLRFRANDGLSVGDYDLNVILAQNPPPTLGYPTVSVNQGLSTTVAPNSGPSDNGSVTLINILSNGTYSGTSSVNSSTGVLSLGNAGPAGTHTITIRATDNCGATRNATVTVQVAPNAAPTFSPGAAISRRQASPSGAAVAVGTVSDAETAAAALQVAAASGGTATGVTISNVSNSNGTVMAQLAANCTATSGTVRVQVSDGTSNVFGAVQVNVLPNTPPSIGTYPELIYVEGESDTVAPSSFISDNGSLGTPIVAVAPASYTGTAAVAPNGTVTLGNIGPLGTYTVGVQAIDNCGATTQRNFDIDVLDAEMFRDSFE